MPIVFEQVDAEISGERGTQPEREAEAQTADPGALARRIVRELDILEERRMRLVAS